jgi:hypothetical protein
MSEAIDLAKPEPEPPTGGEAYTVLLDEVFLSHHQIAPAMDGGGVQ